MRKRLQRGGDIARQRSYAASRHLSRNSGSRLRREISRIVPSSRPGGSASDSTSVTKPWRYGRSSACASGARPSTAGTAWFHLAATAAAACSAGLPTVGAGFILSRAYMMQELYIFWRKRNSNRESGALRRFDREPQRAGGSAPPRACWV